MNAVFNTHYFNNEGELLRAKEELEGIISDNKYKLLGKIEVVVDQHNYIMYNKVFLICPN